MSHLGERGVVCVGNGWHFCTPVLMNMSSKTIQVLRLSTFVFTECSKIIKFKIIFVVKSLKGFGWNNFGPASQTGPALHQHWLNVSCYLVFPAPGFERSPAECSSQKKKYNHPMIFQWRASVEDCGSTLKQYCLNPTCLRKVYNRPGDRLVLSQRRRCLPGIEPAMTYILCIRYIGGKYWMNVGQHRRWWWK